MFQQTLAHLNLEISTPDLWRKEFPCHAIRRHPAKINARCLHDVTRPSLANEMHAVTTDCGDRGCPAPARNMSG